jgi:hypothetical protein
MHEVSEIVTLQTPASEVLFSSGFVLRRAVTVSTPSHRNRRAPPQVDRCSKNAGNPRVEHDSDQRYRPEEAGRAGRIEFAIAVLRER